LSPAQKSFATLNGRSLRSGVVGLGKSDRTQIEIGCATNAYLILSGKPIAKGKLIRDFSNALNTQALII
jgi:hypothetical protein